MTYRIVHSDCVAALREMAPASIDACVTDPPYELGFMGKRWDASGIAYSLDLWREVLRVLKPGGYLLAFGGTRTYHRMACAIEDAGLEVRDSLHWLYGSGFPKSLDVSKAIDGHLEADRPVVGWREDGCAPSAGNATTISSARERGHPATAPATAWSGWGTALKPAHEPIVMARKPPGSTVAACVLAHGCGGLNIEACRVEYSSAVDRDSARVPMAAFRTNYTDSASIGFGTGRSGETFAPGSGRWPPNLLLTHGQSCGDACAPGCPVAEMDRQSGESESKAAPRGGASPNPMSRYEARADGVEVAGHSDSGGASRFFPVFRYVAKPARGERDAGLWDFDPASGGDATDREDGSDGLKSPRAGAGRNGGARNTHPTVKPVALMEWLVQLVTPRGGVVLDPFLGSGSTGCAAVRLGFDFLGVEREAEYVAIAERRIALALNAPRTKPLGALDRGAAALPGQRSLFEAA